MKIMEVATLLGCRIIEKHFTHNKSLPGNDHYHAMDKKDLKKYFTKIERLNLILGEKEKRSLDSELISRLNARRSLVCSKNIKKNSILKVSDITWKRPGKGISPKEIDRVIGKTTLRDIKEDEILDWDMFR